MTIQTRLVDDADWGISEQLHCPECDRWLEWKECVVDISFAEKKVVYTCLQGHVQIDLIEKRKNEMSNLRNG